MNQALQFELVAGTVGLFALLVLYLAYRFLASSHWVMGWIQGNVGLGLLLLTGLLGLAIMDIRTYRPMFDDTAIATLSVHTLGPGSHQLRLVNSKGIEQSYVIAGDQYQLVINQFKWATRFAGMGMGHGYRVDHVVGIQSDPVRETKVPVASSENLDVWRFFHDHLAADFFISAHVVKTAPRPVVDGGMYELIPQAFDINVVALNQLAKEADAATVVVATEATNVAPPTDAPAIPTPVMAVPVPAAPVATPTPPVVAAPPAAPAEMPGAHIQATPATVVEKPAAH